MVLGGVLLALISACSLVSAEVEQDTTVSQQAEPNENPTAKSYWPWAKGEAQKPPAHTPYQLPTIAGDDLEFRHAPAPLVKAPAIDADAVYEYVIGCFPERSQWDLDVMLRGQISSRHSDGSFDIGDIGRTELGGNYVAIVASMPLYSSTELDRKRDREYRRRQDTAAIVAQFVTSIAERNHAVRELALYRSLEARASVRVQQGISEAAEQVGYLEKVAKSQNSLITQEAKITETRLKMAGMCAPNNHDQLNAWLKQVALVPLRDE